MDLTRSFTPEQYARGLESWHWQPIRDKAPRFTSLFGDVFFEAADGGWWVLDMTEGRLTRRWDNSAAVAAALATDGGQDEHLLGGLAMAAHRRGLELAADQVYVFVPPPIIGGGFAVENIRIFDFVVAAHLAGQLHHQLRDKPPGWTTTGFTLAET